MTKKLTLLLFIGLTWGQDNLKKESDFDKLVSKGGTIFLGEYSRIENSVVYFKTTNAMASQGFPLNKIQILQLKDGTTIINDGEINKIDLKNILVQSFRSDLGKFYTVTYSGEFLGQKSNKVYFKPINDASLKLLRLKEVKELKQNNKVLIKNGKWKIEPESIKPYKGTFIDIEEVNTLDRPINKTRLTQVCCAMIIIFGLYTYLTFDISSGGFSFDFNYNNAHN